jgi:hypothetical protein
LKINKVFFKEDIKQYLEIIIINLKVLGHKKVRAFNLKTKKINKIIIQVLMKKKYSLLM